MAILISILAVLAMLACLALIPLGLPRPVVDRRDCDGVCYSPARPQ
jgi:hypothetical protein